MNTRAFVLAAILASGCATLRTGADHDNTADFTSYGTYAWVTDELTLIGADSGQESMVRTEANETRIRAAIDKALAGKGLEKVERDSADLIVTFVVGTKEQIRLEGAESSWGFITADQAEPKYYKGSLSIDLYDRESRRQVWHGWASRPLDPRDDADAVINTAVAKIMAKFPPDKNK